MTEQEELQILRELVKKQQEELEKKDQIIEKQRIQIDNMVQACSMHGRNCMDLPRKPPASAVGR